MPLGVDNARRLNDATIHWDQFRNWFHGDAPEYAGRYFGVPLTPTSASDHKRRWTPGELLGISDAPVRTALKWIVPLSPAFLAEQELDDPVSANRRALQTCERIKLALQPVSGNRELELPATGFVFVFLDVEPQTRLHPNYWAAWAAEVRRSSVTYERPNGLVDFVQPFLPALYCDCELHVGPPATVAPALRPPPHFRGLWQFPYALMTTPFHLPPYSVRRAGAATERLLLDEWPDIPGFVDAASGFTAPLVIWQYKINIGFEATGNPFDRELHPTRPFVFDMDVSVTSAAGYNGRPVTDYMLTRP